MPRRAMQHAASCRYATLLMMLPMRFFCRIAFTRDDAYAMMRARFTRDVTLPYAAIRLYAERAIRLFSKAIMPYFDVLRQRAPQGWHAYRTPFTPYAMPPFIRLIAAACLRVAADVTCASLRRLRCLYAANIARRCAMPCREDTS